MSLNNQFPNCGPNPTAVIVSCEFCTHPPTPTRRDSTVESVCVGGAYWSGLKPTADES